MPVVRHADQRRSETPNGAMTTFASPTLGGSDLALWRVEMQPGAAGPVHSFDVEQIWTVLDGRATVDLDGEQLTASSGDTLVLPAGTRRRIHADPDSGLTAMVTGQGGATATPDGGDPVVPPWVA